MHFISQFKHSEKCEKKQGASSAPNVIPRFHEDRIHRPFRVIPAKAGIQAPQA